MSNKVKNLGDGHYEYRGYEIRRRDSVPQGFYGRWNVRGNGFETRKQAAEYIDELREKQAKCQQKAETTNTLLKRRNGKIYFGAWRIDQYECGLWLGNYNNIKGTNIRPGQMTAELFREFLAYQRRVKRLGHANAPILRERITLSTRHPRINEYADKLNSTDRDRLMLAMYASERVVVFYIDGKRVSLAEVEPAGMVVA